jgi:hypothetical protein
MRSSMMKRPRNKMNKHGERMIMLMLLLNNDDKEVGGTGWMRSHIA